jgi:hypothetical protein
MALTNQYPSPQFTNNHKTVKIVKRSSGFRM